MATKKMQKKYTWYSALRGRPARFRCGGLDVMSVIGQILLVGCCRKCGKRLDGLQNDTFVALTQRRLLGGIARELERIVSSHPVLTRIPGATARKWAIAQGGRTRYAPARARHPTPAVRRGATASAW